MLNILILQLNKHRTSNENGKYHRIFESSTDLDRKQIFLSIIYNDLNSNSYFIYAKMIRLTLMQLFGIYLYVLFISWRLIYGCFQVQLWLFFYVWLLIQGTIYVSFTQILYSLNMHLFDVESFLQRLLFPITQANP